jgi:tripartite-type tricarboxylate transporter receptor subunit TctC
MRMTSMYVSPGSRRHRPPAKFTKAALFSVLALLSIATPCTAQESVAAFYRGKTIEVINPFAEAGLYAYLAQIIADDLPRHVPGSPAGRVEFMPGGGGLQGANYLYNAAPRDGTVIELLYDNMPTEQALGLDQLVKFDARQFRTLGSLNHGETGLVAILKRAGVASVADAKSKTAVLAATGTAAAQYIVPDAMNKLMGTRFNIIPGYKVITDSFLAMESGEADGLFTNFATLVQARPQWVTEKRFAYIAQSADVRDPGFADVPLLQELVSDPIKKETFRFLAMSRIPGKMLVAPPGVPEARVAALRTALTETLRDPAVLDAMAKLNQKIEPRDADDAASVIRETVDADPAVLTRVRDLMQIAK